MPGTHRRPSPRRGLIALNAVLLAALAGVTVAPRATAQNQGSARARGEYTLVGGEISGANANAIYLLDAVNREIITLMWDNSRKRLYGIGYRDLASDLSAEPRR